MKLLEVSSLHLYLETKSSKKKLLDQINFELNEEEITALVGASGSGKTLFANFLADSLPPKIKIEGKLSLNGKEIIFPSSEKRNQEIAMVFQNPSSSLNPLIKIKNQICESFKKEKKLSKKEGLFLAEKICSSLCLEANLLDCYPHELSGGMQQRVALAIALAKEPKLLITDEPTTALDQPLQKEILFLLKEEIKKNKIACLFITHDLSLLQGFCKKISIMHEGKIVEHNDYDQIFSSPQHAYTKAMVQTAIQYEKTCCLY